MAVNIVRWTDTGRVEKYRTFDTLEEAHVHSREHGGMVFGIVPDAPVDDWMIDGDALKVVPLGPSDSDVNAERDRRLGQGFVFRGVRYDHNPTIASFALMASTAIAGGVEAGDLKWHGDDTAFAWIAFDGTAHTMDAHEFLAFSMTETMARNRLFRAARRLKDMIPTPEDYESDDHWQ